MKCKLFFINIIMIAMLILGLVNGTVMAAPQPGLSIQLPNTLRTDAIVLVNSASPNFTDFQHFIQPYLDNFGVPYTVLDIATAQITSGIADYAVIIVGHRQFDISHAFLNGAEEGFITSAINAGTGLVNFDNALSVDDHSPNYQFINSIFNFGYSLPASFSSVTFPTPQSHYITLSHTTGQMISTGEMTMAGITLPAGTSALALSDTQPFLVATSYGQGHAVQWGTYDWMSHLVKGPLMGLDDLVWRSIVWAARKPFTMQGMPPFVTMRMDDVSGPMWWVHSANNYGFIPWLGLFPDDIDASEAADVSSLVNSGKATATIHAFGTSNFFYFDHYNGVNFSDSTMAANYTAGFQWLTSHNIPISKYLVPHYYEIGSNAFAGLKNWGVEFLGTQMDPGQLEASAPWMMKGPYRLYDTGQAYDRSQNPYYTDYMTIPGHPELDGQFFNCMSEIRDVTGYEWLGNGRTSVANGIQDGTDWLKRSFDSMTLATLFSHEYTFVNSVSQADWQSMIQGITQNIASYQPIYVSLDYACQYARAMKTSNITTGNYNPTTSQVTVDLAGKADMATKFYLFTENANSIQQTLVDVPAFTNTKEVVFSIPGPLNHIVVTPTTGQTVMGAKLQFTAQGYDAQNTLITGLTFNWQVANGGGSINASGLFTAGLTPGTYQNTIVASIGSIQGRSSVIINTPVLDHFTFDPINPTHYTGIPFQVTIRAQDINANPVVTFNGPVSLSESTGTLQPQQTGAFTNGVWTGSLTISQASNAINITAREGAIIGTSNTFNVLTMKTCPCSIWDDSATPTDPNSMDGQPVELGVKFQSAVNGYITGLRFFKGNLNTGTHIGHLWLKDGTQLAEATFINETVSGWQQIMLANPVAVTAGTTYVASYHSTAAYYAQSPYYFSSAVENIPLKALADNEDGANGVYAYGSSSFPNQAWTGYTPNYWVDVIFDTQVGPDTTPPSVVSTKPANGATNISLTPTVSARFNEGMLASSINANTIELHDAQGSLFPATVTYDGSTWTATLTLTASLVKSTTYTGVIKSGANGVKDLAGNPLASDMTWSFTTTVPFANEGPGGPVLVIGSADNPFSRYYPEILRAEGLNYYTLTDISTVNQSLLANYKVVILGDISITSSSVQLLTDWVQGGGNLIAMRPSKLLANLLGISDNNATLSDAYIKVDTTQVPGKGIEGATLQYHSAADLYTIGSASMVAALYSDATTATNHPAVTLRKVGASGGYVAAFTYDLARSVVYTRQGNPAWAGQERDGQTPIRADDLFFPDYVNLDKVSIPQADEQQRLLANMIGFMSADTLPLPRFWYFPRGEKAVVIMTGDDHGNGGTTIQFNNYLAASAAGCALDDWDCIRATSYLEPQNNLTSQQAADYQAQGFEIGIHVSTDCADWTPTSLDAFYASEISAWTAKYTGITAPDTHRTHCIVWSDWATQPKVELSYGIRLDTNYYYWPGSWINNRPGMFTGSGMPMRFADLDGTIIDVYQAATQITDESGQDIAYNISSLLDNALGANGYYGAFTMNMHNDQLNPSAMTIVSAAQQRGVPVISARQMLTWLDGRNNSSFGSLTWNGNKLSFTVSAGQGSRGLTGMLPVLTSAGSLVGLKMGDTLIPYTIEVIKGVAYAFFTANPGAYSASYGEDTIPPSVTSTQPVSGASNIMMNSNVKAIFSEAVDPSTLTLNSFELRDSSNATVPGAVSYDAATKTAILTPTNLLLGATTYTATIMSGAGGVKDLAGNPLAADIVWSFTTKTCPCSVWENTGDPVYPAISDNTPIELGFRFRSDMNGYITGLRFFKGLLNTGVHIGHLWKTDGTQLAEAVFVNESASGWQEVLLATPIAITAGTTYIASYYSAGGYFADSPEGFATATDNPPLRALANGEDGANGVYNYGSSGFPNQTYIGHSPNYWVDVIFDTKSAPDTTLPNVSTTLPMSGATGAAVSTNVKATFSEGIDPLTIKASTFSLRDANNTSIPATLSYDKVTLTATLVPSQPLSGLTTYTATIKGGADGIKDLAGNAMATDFDWAFTTVQLQTCPCSLWSGSTTPTNPSTVDNSAVELGVRFKSDYNGLITGIRFYKGESNTGVHMGSLWDSSGNLLSQATFTNEIASGWQEVNFSNPVQIQANTVYIASYHTSTGFYSADNDAFASAGLDVSPLHILRDGDGGGNGLFSYGPGGFPTNSYRATNYWVDVVFMPLSIEYNLTTNVVGNGVIIKSPEKITYNAGDIVQITAQPSTGWSFSAWSGDLQGSTNPTTLAIDSSKSITAIFTLDHYPVSVTKSGNGSGTIVSSPAGIDCGATCALDYNYGALVTLTATPAAGSSFIGWGGDCAGSGTCLVTIDAAKAITAAFTLNRYTLSVTKQGNGSGTVTSTPAGINCGATCASDYDYGTLVTLTAVAATGTTFTGWSGACLGTGSCAVTVNDVKSVIATFALTRYTISISKAGNGSGVVSSAPAGINCGATCSADFDYGTQVTLTAVPATGTTFNGWSGACTGTGTCILTVNSAKSAIATFTLNTYALTVAKSGNGSGTVTSLPTGINCGTTCSSTYNYGTSITLTAVATSGSIFIGWGGACTGTGTCAVTIDTAKNVTASFSLLRTLTVTRAGTGSGTVTSSPAGISCGSTCATTFTDGTSVTLTAVANTGSTFAGWSGACTGTGTCTVAMSAAMNVTATFTLNSYSLSVSKSGSGTGTITSSPVGINCGLVCSYSYNYGATITLTAAAGSGSAFTGWGGDCTGTGACTVPINSAHSVTATFTLTRTLTVTKPGNGSGIVTSSPTGINCGSTCSYAFVNGTSVTLTAVANTGSTFTGWGGSCTGTGTCTVAMTAARSVSANFTLIRYTLSVTKPGNGVGTISSSPTGISCGTTCSSTYDYGTSVVLTAAANTGSTFGGWGGACSGTGTCTVAINAAKSVTATFTLIRYTLTVTKTVGSSYGTVTSSPTGISCGSTCAVQFDYGTMVVLTATPIARRTFLGWSNCPSSSGNTCTVNVTSARTVDAMFR
jgi:hypothetical protein